MKEISIEEENLASTDLTADEEYICSILDDLDLSSISENRLFADKARIDNFYSKSFDKEWKKGKQDYINSTSQATAFFKMLVNRYSAFLFSKFPETSSTNEEIKPFLLKNENKLNSILEKSVKDYILYGSSILEYKNNDLVLIDDYDGWYFYKNLLIKTGDLTATQESKEALQSLLNGVDFDLKEAVVVYYNNNKYLYNKKEITHLPATELSDYCLINDAKPLVNYVYELFYKLEKVYDDKLKALEMLKVVILYPDRLQEVMKKFVSDNFVALGIQGSEYKDDYRALFSIVSNAPIAETITILSSQIAELKQDILTHLDMQDLFNGANDDNPTETRVSASNRVAIAQMNIEANQRKFNDFIERVLKFYISKNLNIEYQDVNLENNSISILQQQQDDLAQEAEYQKILGLLTQTTQTQPPISNIFYSLLNDIVEKSKFLSNKDFIKKTILQTQKQQEQMLQMQMQQSQQPNPELIKLDAMVSKIQADTNKTVVETKKIENSIGIEETLKAKELEVKELQENRKMVDEQQQFLDAQTRAMKAKNNKEVANG